MSALARLLLDGSIDSLDAAASWRLHEAQLLREKGRPCCAVYLFGYVAEMRIVAACLRLVGCPPTMAVSLADLNILKADARQQNLMTSDPHDIAGWARYLLYSRRAHHSRWFGANVRDKIQYHGDGLYEHWRPRLRYKALTPTAAQVAAVAEAAEWFDSNYPVFWS